MFHCKLFFFGHLKFLQLSSPVHGEELQSDQRQSLARGETIVTLVHLRLDRSTFFPPLTRFSNRTHFFRLNPELA